MSKKYRGKLCVYCGMTMAATRDHVFARQFLLERDRGNLPVVPACERCNGRKAVLENYLTSVLPFGGRHSQAAEAMLSGVPKRLDRNKRLRQHLQGTMTPAWVREGSGLFLPTSMFSFDGSTLEELLKFIARGLAYHHWDTYVEPDSQPVPKLPVSSTIDCVGVSAKFLRANRKMGNVPRPLNCEQPIIEGLMTSLLSPVWYFPQHRCAPVLRPPKPGTATC